MMFPTDHSFLLVFTHGKTVWKNNLKMGRETETTNGSKTISKLPPRLSFKMSHSKLSRLRTPFEPSGPGTLQPLGRTMEKTIERLQKTVKRIRLGLAGAGRSALQIVAQWARPESAVSLDRKAWVTKLATNVMKS